MATEQSKPATEEAKIDLFEDDDEFEEFEIDYDIHVHDPTPTYCRSWAFDRPAKSFPVILIPILAFISALQLIDLEDKEEGKEALQQWEDDWDDDDLNDDFSLQLRRELEGNTEKNEAKST